MVRGERSRGVGGPHKSTALITSYHLSPRVCRLGRDCPRTFHVTDNHGNPTNQLFCAVREEPNLQLEFYQRDVSFCIPTLNGELWSYHCDHCRSFPLSDCTWPAAESQVKASIGFAAAATCATGESVECDC